MIRNTDRCAVLERETETDMSAPNIGIWLIGAWGRIGAATAYLVARNRLSSRDIPFGHLTAIGLLSADEAASARCEFVLGGHEIRRTSNAAELAGLLGEQQFSNVDPVIRPHPIDDQAEPIAEILAACDRNVRTGTLYGIDDPAVIARASTAAMKTIGESAATAVERASYDLRDFQNRHRLEHVVVVNVASCEASLEEEAATMRWPEFARRLSSGLLCPVRASALYALAAMNCGCSYINATSSVGSDLPALHERALQQRTLHAGGDLIAGSADTAAIQIVMLVRIADDARRSGEVGVMTKLSRFFHRPIGTSTG